MHKTGKGKEKETTTFFFFSPLNKISNEWPNDICFASYIYCQQNDLNVLLMHLIFLQLQTVLQMLVLGLKHCGMFLL